MNKHEWGAAAGAMDAGSSIQMTGPLGAYTIPSTQKGQYQLPFGPSASVGIFPAGTYTVTGSGGQDVGAFSALLRVSDLQWTNQAAIASVDRTQPLRITWTGGTDPGYVLFGGASSSDRFGLGFSCIAPASAHELTVPAYVLSALPASTPDHGYLFLGVHPMQNAFSAPGISYGVFSDLGSRSKQVQFK